MYFSIIYKLNHYNKGNSCWLITFGFRKISTRTYMLGNGFCCRKLSCPIQLILVMLASGLVHTTHEWGLGLPRPNTSFRDYDLKQPHLHIQHIQLKRSAKMNSILVG